MCCAYFVLIIFQAINKFAWARHPGIYKQDYIDNLYMFYHEKKPEDLVCPQTPEWKRLSDPDFHGVALPAVDNNGDIPQQVHTPFCWHSLSSFLEVMICSAAAGCIPDLDGCLESNLMPTSLYMHERASIVMVFSFLYFKFFKFFFY